MFFDVLGAFAEVETIAAGRGIHGLSRLNRLYGRARWRKLKGIALVRLGDGWVGRAELHWYEAAGIGKKELKIKRYLE